MAKIDRYVLTEFWLPLVSGAGIITGVWLGIDKFKEVFKLLAKSGAPFSTGIVILGLETPQILAITIPISILLATFLTFQKLSAQSEIIAMRAAGVSFTRLMRPVFYLGLLGMVICFILYEFIVPFTNPFAQKVYMLSLYQNPIETKGVNGFTYFEKDSDDATKRIFYVRKFKDDYLKDVVILDFSKKNISMIHTARKGEWDPKRGGWILYDGSSSYIKNSELDKSDTELESESEMDADDFNTDALHLVTNFKETLIPSSLNPNTILKEISNVRDMNFWQLRKLIRSHEKGHIFTDKLNEYRTKYFNKYAYPFSAILLAIIGACLGITGRRRAVNWGYIALGLIVFVFYMSQTVFDSYGQSGKIDPMIAVWMPNFILGIIAASVYFYRANK
jgi:lipopolysaccharide export system permease protein